MSEEKEPKKCHFCGRFTNDVEPLTFEQKETPPLCPSCVKKLLLFYLYSIPFLEALKKREIES